MDGNTSDFNIFRHVTPNSNIMKTKELILMMALFVPFFTSAQIPMNGLIAYYPFNGNANDESGNGYDGVNHDAVLTNDRYNENNKAFYFNNGSYISTTPPVPTGNESRTISAWFNTTSASGSNGWYNNSIFSYGSPTQNNMFAAEVYEGNLLFDANGEGASGYAIVTGEKVNDGLWHHVVVTSDETKVIIYLDNVEIGNIDLQLATNNSPFCVGRRYNQESQYMDGKVDDIFIYNRALNESEISALYNYSCITHLTSDTIQYYVSNADFEIVSPKIYLETIDSLTNNNGCDSLIYHYSQYTYDPTVCTFYDSITVTDTLIIDVLLTGVQPPDDINTLKVYPNPAKDYLIINTGNYSEMTDYSIKIVNELGAVVFETEVTQPSYEINLSTWTGKGLYVLQVLDNNNTIKAVKKIILQ